MPDNFKYHIKKWLPFILMILVLLFFPALWFLRDNGFIFFEKKVRKETLRWAHQDSIRVGDSLKKIHHSPSGKSDKEENPISVRDARDTYYIIAGSFTNHENARLEARKYRSLGYKTSIISMTDLNGIKTELVSVNTFNNFDEAARYLSEFKSKFNPSAWIFSKK